MKPLLIFLICTFSLLFIQKTSAQDSIKNAESIRLTFERPSVSQVYLRGNLSQEARIYEGFQNLKGLSDNRADYNDIGFPSISGFADFSDENYQKSIHPQLQRYFNQVVALYWSRDAKGNFSDELIRQRGNFTATDGQMIADEASENSRIGDLGYDLIEKSYIFVFDVLNIRTFEEVYNQKDAARRKSVEDYNKKLKEGQAAKKFEPVKRIKQGWEIEYAYSVYKLKWNEDIQNDFFDNFWVDENTKEGRAQKIAAFKAKNFEYEFVTSRKTTFNETKLKSSDSPVNPEVMNQLLLTSSGTMQMLALSGIESSIEDFRLRTNIYSAYPIRAKLGTKESLKKEDRYFLYELSLNEQGEKEKHRIGWAYVTKVAKNNKVADGEMPTSKFKQHGGNKVYSGVLMEEMNDLGLNINLGMSRGNQFYQGVNLGLELNTSKIISIVPGLYLGANLSIGGSKNQNLGEIIADDIFIDSIGPDEMFYTDYITFDDSLYNTSQVGLSVYIGKEFYFLPNGNISIFPIAGVAFNNLSITERNGRAIYSSYETPEAYSFSTFSSYISIAVGYNISPGMNIYIEPVIRRNGNMTNDFSNVQQTSSDADINKSFKDLNASPMLINFGVRFRL